MMLRKTAWGTLVLAFAMSMVMGCATESGDEVDHAAKAVEKAVIETVSQEVRAKLVLADAVDGTEDQVVQRCGGCKLGMDGDAKHALKVGDYKMQFCSAECKAHFSEDTEKAILTLVVPTESSAH